MVTKRLRDLRYQDVRRQRTERGFVPQHVLRARGPEGQVRTSTAPWSRASFRCSEAAFDIAGSRP